MTKPVNCACGRKSKTWSVWRNGRMTYFCGCINPDCLIRPFRSVNSKEEVIENWNKKMKGANKND